jgi:hypothetical protein
MLLFRSLYGYGYLKRMHCLLRSFETRNMNASWRQREMLWCDDGKWRSVMFLYGNMLHHICYWYTLFQSLRCVILRTPKVLDTKWVCFSVSVIQSPFLWISASDFYLQLLLVQDMKCRSHNGLHALPIIFLGNCLHLSGYNNLPSRLVQL